MAPQLIGVLRRPTFGLLSLGISLLFALLFLYSDSFVFFSPHFVVYVPLDSIPYLLLDLVISTLSGIAISGSIYQLRFVPYASSRNAGAGLAGMLAAIVAGACPAFSV